MLWNSLNLFITIFETLSVQKIEFSLKLPANARELYDCVINFDNHKKAFPSQLKNIEIVENDGTKITTKETLVFNTYIGNTEINQKTIHERIFPNIKSEIIEGPFKNSKINVIFEELGDGTRVSCKIELSVSLKYKILSSIIIKKYKIILTSLLYKMNSLATEK